MATETVQSFWAATKGTKGAVKREGPKNHFCLATPPVNDEGMGSVPVILPPRGQKWVPTGQIKVVEIAMISNSLNGHIL